MHLQPNLTGLGLLCSDQFNSISEFLTLTGVIIVNLHYSGRNVDGCKTMEVLASVTKEE